VTASGEGRAEAEPLAGLESPKLLGVALGEAQQVAGSRDVDVEGGAAHEDVGGLSGGVLVELGEPLGGEDGAEASLATL